MEDGRRVVVKLDAEVHRHRRELHALRLAAAHGVAVPDVVLAQVDVSPAVLVLGWVDGVPLASRADDDDAWSGAFDALARLHTIDAGPFGWRAELVRVLRRNVAVAPATVFDGRTVEEVGRRLEEALGDAPETTTTLIHGDAQPEHVLVDEAGTAHLIDFGDSSSGDPLYDVVVLTLHARHRAPVSTLAETYRLHRLFGEAVWMHEHGYDPTLPAGAVRAFLEEGS